MTETTHTRCDNFPCDYACLRRNKCDWEGRPIMTEAAKHTPNFWTAVGNDERMAHARRVLSLDELRSIAIHAWDNPVYRLWQDADTAPQTGFFLAWSPDFPDMVSCWKAEIFHQARSPGTPKHLSAVHFTKWMPCPLPSKED